MSNLIELGTLDGTRKPVQLDVPVLLETGMVVQAQSGGGKSWAIRRLLEQTHSLVQQTVLDLEGEFPTLREIYDYIIAGKGGDIGITVQQKMPQLLAIKLLELKVSSIIDLYELKAHDRIKFVRQFLESVMDSPKSLYHPVLFVLDEAHHFCPQVGEAESYAAVIDLCARGRKRGFRPILATQRISKLHKDACAELGNKMIGRTGLDIDQKRAADELDMGKSDRLGLRNLHVGQFYVYGPALRVDGKPESGVVLCKVGKVESRHPQAGARQLEAPPEASSAVKKIVTSLANLPAEAERKLATEEAMRKEISDLRRQLTITQKPGTGPTSAQITELKAESNDWRSKYQALSKVHTRTLVTIDRAISSVTAKGKELTEAIRKVEILVSAESATEYSIDLPEKKISPSLLRNTAIKALDRPNVPRSPRLSTGDLPEGLGKSHQRILNAIGSLEAAGIVEPPRATIAARSGFAQSGTFSNYMSELRVAGLVEYCSNGVTLTDEGRSVADIGEVIDTLESLHEFFYAWCNGAQRQMLQHLISVYPRSVTRTELAEAVGMAQSGTFSNYVSELSTKCVVEYPQKGRVRATDLLFPEGLK